MKKVAFALGLCAALLVANRGMAQCQGGGGGAAGSAGTTTAGATGGVATTGGTLFMGPGSLAFDMMRAAAMQQQVAQMQMVRAQQAAAQREARLAQRRENAEKTRLATAIRRERTRQMLADQNGIYRPPAVPQRPASVSQLARR